MSKIQIKIEMNAHGDRFLSVQGKTIILHHVDDDMIVYRNPHLIHGEILEAVKHFIKSVGQKAESREQILADYFQL